MNPERTSDCRSVTVGSGSVSNRGPAAMRTRFASALVEGRSIGLPDPIDASSMASAQGRTTSFDAIADAASMLLHGSTLSLRERRRLAPMIPNRTPESLRRAVALVVASPESQLA